MCNTRTLTAACVRLFCWQSLGQELQCLLELLDAPDRQKQLGLAEVHVSLATLEEVFLTVVKQVRRQDCHKAHCHNTTSENQHLFHSQKLPFTHRECCCRHLKVLLPVLLL